MFDTRYQVFITVCANGFIVRHRDPDTSAIGEVFVFNSAEKLADHIEEWGEKAVKP